MDHKKMGMKDLSAEEMEQMNGGCMEVGGMPCRLSPIVERTEGERGAGEHGTD